MARAAQIKTKTPLDIAVSSGASKKGTYAMKTSLTQINTQVNIDLNDIIVIRGIIKANRCGIQIVTRSEGSGFITATRQQVLGLENSLLEQNWRVNASLYDEGFSARPEAVQNGSIPFDGSAVDSPAELGEEEYVGVR